MYVDGSINQPSTLRVVPAPGWKIATGLPAVAGQPNTFRAENFDILYDSPVECSNFKELDFQVRGVPHRIVIDGEGNYDPERMRTDVQKIVEAETSMFGRVPYHDYTFILHLRSNTGGGLEHLNSTALGFKRFNFSTEKNYRSFLSLVAHEFFHLWNVKRIRPDALGPFDYTKENYTRLLWVAEGITEYYGNLKLVFLLQINLNVVQAELLKLHPAEIMDIRRVAFHLLELKLHLRLRNHLPIVWTDDF